jgi:hypothetical protein
MQPTCFGKYTQPVTLFCIPTDVWRYIILKDMSYEQLKRVSLVSKAFDSATHDAMAICAHRYFCGKNIVLESLDEARRAYMYLEYVCWRFGRLTNIYDVMNTFGLVKREWDAIAIKLPRFKEKEHGVYFVGDIFIEALRQRQSFVEYLDELALFKDRRSKRGALKRIRDQAKREKEEEAQKEKKQKQDQEERIAKYFQGINAYLTRNGFPTLDKLPRSEALDLFEASVREGFSMTREAFEKISRGYLKRILVQVSEMQQAALKKFKE